MIFLCKEFFSFMIFMGDALSLVMTLSIYNLFSFIITDIKAVLIGALKLIGELLKQYLWTITSDKSKNYFVEMRNFSWKSCIKISLEQ